MCLSKLRGHNSSIGLKTCSGKDLSCIVSVTDSAWVRIGRTGKTGVYVYCYVAYKFIIQHICILSCCIFVCYSTSLCTVYVVFYIIAQFCMNNYIKYGCITAHLCLIHATNWCVIAHFGVRTCFVLVYYSTCLYTHMLRIFSLNSVSEYGADR